MATKKDKYVVLKRDDLRSLSFKDRELFSILVAKVRVNRKEEGKDPFPKYIICNLDEPYSEHVWQTILAGESSKIKRRG